MLSLSVYEPIAINILLGGPSPNFGGRSGVRGSSVVPMNAHHNGHNLSLETVTLSCFVYEQDALQVLGLGEATPNLGDGVELGGRVWYLMKAHQNGHNLSYETVTLSCFV